MFEVKNTPKSQNSTGRSVGGPPSIFTGDDARQQLQRSVAMAIQPNVGTGVFGYMWGFGEPDLIRIEPNVQTHGIEVLAYAESNDMDMLIVDCAYPNGGGGFRYVYDVRSNSGTHWELA